MAGGEEERQELEARVAASEAARRECEEELERRIVTARTDSAINAADHRRAAETITALRDAQSLSVNRHHQELAAAQARAEEIESESRQAHFTLAEAEQEVKEAAERRAALLLELDDARADLAKSRRVAQLETEDLMGQIRELRANRAPTAADLAEEARQAAAAELDAEIARLQAIRDGTGAPTPAGGAASHSSRLPPLPPPEGEGSEYSTGDRCSPPLPPPEGEGAPYRRSPPLPPV